MKVAVFSAKSYERAALTRANDKAGHELQYFKAHLDPATAELARGFAAVSAFVCDQLDAETLGILSKNGTRFLALRSAGFNHLDLPAAAKFNLKVCRVPAYSPHAVAEHTIALLLTLNRKTHKAYNRVREGNFSLEGLVGYDLNEKSVGIIGTGKIGFLVAQILLGFGCKVFAFDPIPNKELEKLAVSYCALDDLLRQADILSFHCPLSPQTFHLLNAERLKLTRKSVIILNTGRGALIDAKALIEGLKSSHIGAVGLDVYEEEEHLFFEDLSSSVITDDVFARLLTFPNVLITGHQGFLTETALRNIAETTLENITAFEQGAKLVNEVKPPNLK